MKWLIWSNEHRTWWRENSCGYSSNVLDAGEYDLEEAVKICGAADYRCGTARYAEPYPPECMVPAEFRGRIERRISNCGQWHANVPAVRP